MLITCSTMNRAYPQVADALQHYAVPVLQIDQPMMERAVDQGGKVLVVATHGPTVNSTQALLQETASSLGREVAFSGTTVESAWECLAAGDVPGHNRALAQAIHAHLDREACQLRCPGPIIDGLSAFFLPGSSCRIWHSSLYQRTMRLRKSL